MRLRTAGLGVGAVALACAGPGEVPTETPEVADPAAAAAIAAPKPATDPGKSGWPRYSWPKIAAEHHPLPGVLDVEVTADGTAAWILTATDVFRWTFGGGKAPSRIGPANGAKDLVASGFDDHVFAVVTKDAGSALEVWTADLDRAELYATDGTLSDPVTGVATWDGDERVFLAHRAGDGAPRILSIRADGTRRYEVTGPSGKTALTEAGLHEDTEDAQAPYLLDAASAVPLSLDPQLGHLMWRDGSDRVHRYRYSDGNWGKDETIDLSAPAGLRMSPNGWLSAVLDPDSGEAILVRPDGDEVGRVSPPGGRWASVPTWTPNGRTLVGATASGVVAVPVDLPEAPVRWLRADDVIEAGGLLVEDTTRDQIYVGWEAWAYSEQSTPVFASIDGMLEVLHAGFEAVFLRNERERSIPALRAYAEALRTAARSAKSERVAGIAAVTLELLDGKPVHPDAKAATEASGSESELHPSPDPIDWGDFVPRGPYANDPALQQYFRAFKYMNLTELKPGEQKDLAKDAGVVAALRYWVSVQDAFLSGSRDTGMFDSAPKLPSWARERCLVAPKTRMFPLSWGLDTEILERLVAHDKKPECGVPLRGRPSGLDLLIGLGSPWASTWVEPDERFGEALAAAHTEVARELGKPLTLPGVVPGWWRIVQVLGADERVPEGVREERWRGRLAETALASWTSLRHTMVLVNATSAAEAGEGGDPIFESLSLEPATHAVDPVPAAWKQLANVLGQLQEVASRSQSEDRVEELIMEARATADTFGGYATRQMAGEALTDAEYDTISTYARTVEHPYVLLKTAAAAAESLSDPEPMSKIVDVHVWDEPNAGTSYLHVAVGNPRDVQVLIGDRGILLPADGALYSYYEWSDDHRLDDDEWRRLLESGEPKPPAFSPAAQ